jgi:lysophospholipase L1-like esterase
MVLRKTMNVHTLYRVSIFFTWLMVCTVAHAQRYLDREAIRDAQSDVRQQPGYAWDHFACLRCRSKHPDVLILGDSIFDGWSGYLLLVFPNAIIDAKVGRQFSGGITQYRSLLRYSGVRKIRTIVVELGTNGAVTHGQVARFMQLAGPERRVIFIVPEVPRPWEKEVQTLYAGLPTYYKNVRLVWWNRLSTTSSGQERAADFWPDGVHPNWTGIQAMVHGLQAIIWKGDHDGHKA